MDIGSNISKLIQSAIKTKLIGLNAYVDDELPDYIMIMIANKKPEDQMYEALSLFLSDQAGDFTKWLYQLLKALKGTGDKEKIVRDSLKPKEVVKVKTVIEIDDNESKKGSRWDIKDKQKSVIDGLAGKRKSVSAEAVIEITNETDDFFDQEILECENLSKPKKDSKTKEVVPKKKFSPVTAPKKKLSPEIALKKKLSPEIPPKMVVQNKPKSSAIEASASRKSKKHSKKRKSENENLLERTIENKIAKRKDDSEKKHKKKLKRQKKEKTEEKKITPVVIYKETSPPLKEIKIMRKRKPSNGGEEIERKKLSSTVTLPKLYKDSIYISDDSDCDIVTPSQTVVSKVSKVRQTTRLPLNKQASKNLLLKAVSEAEISVRKSRILRQNHGDSQPDIVTRIQRKVDVKKAAKPAGFEVIRKHLDIGKVVETIPKVDKVEKVEKVEVKDEAPVEKEKEIAVLQCDSRRIICKDREIKKDTGRRKLVRNIPSATNSVQFDSRKAELKSKQNNDDLKPEIPKIVEDKIQKKERSVSPCFVVTLDGDVSSKKSIKNNGIEAKKFKAVNIEAPYSASKQATSQLSTPKTELESSDVELSQMRAQLIKMQEETRKLKSIQDELQKKSAVISALNGLKNETKSIHVANVHFSATEKQLAEHFSVCGKVLRTTIVKDAFTGISKGFAYLEFDEANSMTMALALDSTPFCSRIIKVSKKDDLATQATPSMYRPRNFYPVRYRSRYAMRKPNYSAPTRFFAKNKTWVKSDHVKM